MAQAARCGVIDARIVRLQERVAELEQENEALRNRIALDEQEPREQAGFLAERLLATLIANVAGEECMDWQQRLQAKYSALSISVHGRPTKRWVWNYIGVFGPGQRRKTHVLIGDTDERFRDFYRDPISKYVLFALPTLTAIRLAAGNTRSFTLTTNPCTVRTETGRAMFNKYQITLSELIAKYCT
ncbi:MAG: hypothetical protein WDA75_23890 [Candidatus Latescibacterota bacterium]|jgi:hypothetical protein